MISVSSAAALVFHLPGVCTHTDTEGKQRKARVRNNFKVFRKNTIFNEYPVCSICAFNLTVCSKIQALHELLTSNYFRPLCMLR